MSAAISNGLMLVGGAVMVLWLWRRASAVTLNVFTHAQLWMLAGAAIVLIAFAGDNGTWTPPAGTNPSMSGMDGLQWGVVVAMVIVPIALAWRAMSKSANVLTAAGVRAVAVGLVVWIAVGYATAPLYYGCNPINPFCHTPAPRSY